jgi:galactokinase
LIGEHTDYNEGFVLPAAIDKEIFLALAKNGGETCRVFSFDYEEMQVFNLRDLSPAPSGWINYITGVLAQLMDSDYHLEGFDCVFGGNIPIGAGLSSSAALENGICYGLSELFNLKLDPLTMIKFSQKAEHEYAGVACGIMDQFASMLGKAGHAIRLDCRSLDFTYFPLHLEDYQFILCDTQVKHTLVDTEYNVRRMECEIGVKSVKKYHGQVISLRDVSYEMLENVRHEIPSKVYQRCLYVLEENNRLLKACQLLERGDLEGFGVLMYGSHQGLSKLYEVSCPELDFLVDFTRTRSEVLGSRMMGGGFGGCTLNLVAKKQNQIFKSEISAAYQEIFGHPPHIYEVSIVNGTSSMTES